MAVEIKQAVANAMEFASGVLGDRVRGVQLEEVESWAHDGVSAWQITLSMDPTVGSALMLGRRDYKTFTVRKDTGEVIAMKIREFAGE